jgi:hypothetical protein
MEDRPMTPLMEQALSEAAKLSDSEQDALAAIMLREIEHAARVESARPAAISEDEFEARLLESGFLSRSYGPRPARPGEWNFTPITVEGEPLSETIIRERG